MQLLSHPLTPEELEDFTINQLAVHMEYSVRDRAILLKLFDDVYTMS